MERRINPSSLNAIPSGLRTFAQDSEHRNTLQMILSATCQSLSCRLLPTVRALRGQYSIDFDLTVSQKALSDGLPDAWTVEA